MITSRFNKDEAALQRDYMVGKLKTRRLLLTVAEFAVMLLLYVVMQIFFTPYTRDPPYFPIFPPVLILLAFGAVFVGTGAYFRKRIYDLSDLLEKPVLRARYGRVALVWILVFAIVLCFMLPLLAPGTNYAESFMAQEGDHKISGGSDPGTFMRLNFQGSDLLGTYFSEVSVTCTNGVNLSYYLLLKSDADNYEKDPTALTANIDHRFASTTFSYEKDDLDTREYTLMVFNNDTEDATIHYVRFERTNDSVSLFFALFFLVYIGMTAGWAVYVRSLARREGAPAPEPPVPLPMAAQPGRPGAPIRGPGLPVAAQPRPMAAALEPPGAPEPPSPAGGVRMSITCPRCNTTFEVVRGSGPTRIKCPGCGKEGTLAGLPAAALAAAAATQAQPQAAPVRPQAPPPAYPPAPAMARPPPAPGGYEPVPAEPPVEPVTPYPAYGLPPAPAGDMYPSAPAQPVPPAPPSRREMPPEAPVIPEAVAVPVSLPPPAPSPVTPLPAVEKRSISCPRCKQVFQIDKAEGPQRIRCPHCGKEGTIGAKKPPAPAATAPVAGLAPAPSPPTPAARPAPAAPAPVPRARAAPAISTPAPAAPGPLPAAPGPKMIACPACKKPFPVAETRRPLQVKCPNCGKEGMLRK